MEIIYLTPQLWQTEDITKLSKALIGFSKDFQDASLKKDAKNPHLRNSYLSLDNILNTVRPLLYKNGLTVIQDLAGDYLITTILHESGQYRGSAMLFNPMSGNKGTNNLQQIGGGITYAKRYAISAILAISVDTDDDGNSMKNNAPVKKTELPKGMHKHALSAYVRDGNFNAVEQKYTLSAATKKTILALNKEQKV
tara:strand:+ start:9865 stop:10452 length:588 start_codon:yes stop_codon:yes gene_type:complete